MTASPRQGRDERFVLAVDLGTGGLKVGLVSLVGQMAWQDHATVKTRRLGDGGAVQDAGEWWDIVSDATRRALAESDVTGDQVAAVSVTGQWASTVPVDAAGLPVSDCVMWMDTRGGQHSRRRVGGPAMGYAPRAAATWVRRSGAVPSTAGDDPVGHMLHLQHDQPRVAAAARWYLEPVDYLSMRFTGVAAASPASMTGAWLVDTRAPDRPRGPGRRLGPRSHGEPGPRRPGAAPAYDPVLVRLSGVDAAKLPPLRPTGTVIGTVMADVASALGLATGTKVVTGTPDLHTAAVGAGAVLDREAHLAVSTTSWISCPVREKKTDIVHQLATVPGLDAGGYLVVNNQDTAGLAFSWLLDNVVAPADAVAPAGPSGRERGRGAAPPDLAALDALAATAPAGAGQVIFTPWLKGERSPVDDRNARGGFHNLSLATTRAHLARAVMEGVADNSRWLLQSVEKFVGRRLDPIRIIGGGAQSDLWCQVMADVTDRRIERVAEPLHANLRGAALFAGLALDAVAPEEIRGLVDVDATFVPNPENRATYDRLFAEFAKLYKANKAMFARLNRGR